MAGQTKFADMGAGARNGWLLWCAPHDWGADPHFVPYYDEATGEVVTFDIEQRGPHTKGTEARHKTPAELKGWAGY